MRPSPYKLGAFNGTEWFPVINPNVWQRDWTTGPERLIVAPAASPVDVLLQLTRVLQEPFGILYVLLAPRTGAKAGRYQNPTPADREEMEGFFATFREYFESDARHHVWVASLPDQATVVYDNHNVLYAYGPLPEYEQVLAERGLRRGEVVFPVPHEHNYNSEFDSNEKQIMNCWHWVWSPLTEHDQ